MFDIKLVAYEPFGDRIGELPQPLSIEVGDPLSDMPSMRLKYSRDAIGADLLNKDIEVAVEVYDPNTRTWSEPPNGRFLRVRVEGDTLDPIDGLQYMFPGYSWLLTRMRIYPLSATFVQGQVQDASQQEKASLAALNAAEDNVLRALGMKLDTRVEFEKGYPDSQKSVWIDISDLKKPVVKIYKDNEWKTGNAASQRAAVNAVNKWVEHQQSQGQLKDVQDRSRLTKRSFVGRHAGSVFAELLGEAKQRGRLSGMTYKFTTTHDSAGKPWPSQTGMVQVNTGTDLGALLTTFVEGGQLDFRTQGRELQVYIQDTVMNRAPQEDVILRYGLQIDEAPDRSTLEGLAGEVLFMGDDGLMFTRSNPEAMRPWGVWESSKSQSGIKSEAAGQVYAKAALAEAAGRRIERTRGLQFHDGITEPLPYVHYLPGDYIFAPGADGKSERQRVQQITLTKDGTKGSVSGNLVLNDRFLEHEIRTARRVQAVTNGSSIGGTGSMPEQEQYVDLRTPNPPRYVHGEGEGEYVKNLGFKAFINAEWYWDGNATNGTSMVDGLSSYEVQYRPIREGTLGNQSNAMAWLKAPSAGGDDPTVSFGPVDGWDARLNSTVTYELRVRAVAQNGKVSAWSRTAAIKVSGDAIPPTPPSRPSARAEGSVIWVEWDGKMNSGGQPPSDFFSIQIHEAKVPEGTPTEDDGSIADSHLDALSYSLVESTPLTDTGSAPVFDREYGVNYAYKFTATDFFGNRSEMSPPSGSVHTVPLVDDAFLQDRLKQAREEAERQQAELQKKLDAANAAIVAGSERLDGVVDSVTHAEEAALASDKKATDALNKAGAAQASASGKTTITRALEPRTTQPGTAVGDTHFTMSSMDGSGVVTRQQRWDGSTWQDETVGHQVLASLDLGKATVGELNGGRIKAGTIASDRVAVGIGDNALADPFFADPDFNTMRASGSLGTWTRGESGTSVWFETAATDAQQVLRYASISAMYSIPTVGGMSWRFTAEVDSGGGRAGFAVRWFDRTGASTSGTIGTHTTGTGRRTVAVDWTAPDAAVRFQIEVFFLPVYGTTRKARVYGGASVRARTGTVLIEDGAITGEKVNAQSVAAATGKFLSLDVGQLTTTGTANINEAVVNNLWAKKIATEKIVTNEMLIGRGTNLVVNGYGEMGDTTNFSKFSLMEDASLDSAIGATRTFYSYNNNDNLELDSTIPVTPGSSYAFRVSSRGKNAGQMFFVRCSWRDKDGIELSGTYSVNGVKVPVDSWGTYDAILTAPEGAVQAMLQIYTNHARGTQGENQWHAFGSLEFRDAAEGRLIVDGSISTQHVNAETFDVTKLLKANSIEAQYLKVDQIKDAVRIDSDIFNGRLYRGATFQGGEFRTHDSRDVGLAFFPGGMRVTNPSTRVRTFDINAATGDVTIVGEFSTAPEGRAGIKILNSASSWNNSDLGVWFTLDGNPYGWGVNRDTATQDKSVAGMYLTPDAGGTEYSTLQLRGRGRWGDIMNYGGLTIKPNPNNGGRNPFLFMTGTGNQYIVASNEMNFVAGSPNYFGGKLQTGGGDIKMWTGNGASKFIVAAGGNAEIGASKFVVTASGTSDIIAGGTMGFEVGNGRGIYLKSRGMSRYNKQSSKGGNLRLAADGCLVEDLSSREGKADIQPAAPDERVFDIQPVTYMEKALENEYEELDQCPRPMTLQQDMAIRAIECGPDRMFSAIAEEVHDLGLTDLVNYDLDDKPSSLRLELLGLKLLPFVKELWEFKKKYEPVIQKLAS